MVALATAMPAPPAPVHPLKSALKRKRPDDGADDQTPPPTQPGLKRVKVTFDSAVQVDIPKAWTSKSLVLVREEVRRALERHRSGESAAYETLRQIFNTKPFSDDAPTTGLLSKYVMTITSFVGLVDRRCGSLVDSILNSYWLGRDEGFLSQFQRLLVSLVSTHGAHAHLVMQSLVDKFISLRSSAGRLPGHDIVRRFELLDRLHKTLKCVLDTVPSSVRSLSSAITNGFPYSTESTQVHVDYVTNIIRVASYAPALKAEILSLTTDRLVKIDVQIQVDIEDLDEDMHDSLLQDVTSALDRTEKEGEADANVWSDSSDDDSDISTIADAASQRLEQLKVSVTKLDAILDLLFDYYDKAFENGKEGDKIETFEQLVAIFLRSILPTYRSRHVQFLLFHFGQSLPNMSDRFAAALTKIAFDKNQPAMLKISAAAYLASFIARGTHVPRSTVVSVYASLCTELDRLRDVYERSGSGPSLQRYGVYYAIAQALLYMFCFRWRDLLVDPEGFEDQFFEEKELEWIPGVKEQVTRNIYSALNPLKVCSPAIVMQFARIANHLRFIYVFPLIETNKRVRLTKSMAQMAAGYDGMVGRETALSSKTGESAFQLDAYFPFDPYHLPRSKRWVSGDYVEWKSPPGMEEDGSDSEADEAQDAEEEDDDDDDDDDDQEDDGDDGQENDGKGGKVTA
ncbi:RNA polymerase I-specific transcription initiation factor RRN3 [Trichodelitschia bisporula]|uniref:RNA polymerase I-specific transcription initiation factor RRN3 n=1 Tax=Trichodelitschia bisporula TaxID=703511 RepID=A0A6G1HXE1_9PEZI|nr:RNA polymerase I-specific transcription initiation factor RRN3 [Trichodelitschia bisporula]